MSLRKKTAYFLLSLFPLLYVSSCPEADTYEPDDPIEPTEEQLDFLKQAAGDFDYIALAVTDHTVAVQKIFAYNTKITNTARKAGKTHHFIEADPDDNAILSQRPIKDEFVSVCKDKFSGIWVSNGLTKDSICHTFYRAVTQPDSLRFVAVDARLEGENKTLPTPWPIKMAYQFQYLFHRRLGRAPILGLAAFLTPDNQELDVIKVATNDTRTAELIIETADNGILSYGAGHFEGVSRAMGLQDNSLRHLLNIEGRSLLVINVYKNPEDRDKYIKLREGFEKKHGLKRMYSPDVEFFVFPGDDDPDGLEILNPALGNLGYY